VRIHQHVNERVPHRPRRGQRARVAAVTPDRTSPTQRTVDRAGDADRQPAHSATEREFAVCLDDQMQVIILHAELNDTKAASRRARQSDTNGFERSWDAKPANTCTQRYVNGGRRKMRRPGTVRHARAATRRELATRARTRTAPCRVLRKRQLHRSCHLERAIIHLF
jgi:hypothetical protein